MTTKPRRAPVKPPPNAATSWLIAHALPFLSLDFASLDIDITRWVRDEQPKGDGKAVLLHVATIDTILEPTVSLLAAMPTFSSWKPETIRLVMTQCGWEKPDKLRHLLRTVAGCWTMIRVATMPHAVSGHHVPMAPYVDLLTWVREALGVLRPWAHWHAPGSTAIEWLPVDGSVMTKEKPGGFSEGDRFNGWLAGLRGHLVWRIGEAFEATKGATPNGAHHIGVCPRCSRMFAKRRSDQVYDRPTCQKEATRGNTKTR